MAPDERRQAIIEATLPLLLAKGPELSTREIAQAAGIAEGTIFRVFETKHDLVHATIAAALQPDAAMAAIATLPDGQPLAERVTAVLRILRGEIDRTRSLFSALFANGRPTHPPVDHGPPRGGPPNHKLELVVAAAAALEPYASQLRFPPSTVARILSALAFSATIATTAEQPLDPSSTLADALLFGIAEGNS